MTTAHNAPHPHAGETVQVRTELHTGMYSGEAVLEDWWDRVAGMSWRESVGNPAALQYALKAGMQNLPLDDEVVYVKINSRGHLLHASELVD